MTKYRDEVTGLPLPSYDLWEERRGVLAFTCGAVWAGLMAASRFAHAFGESALAERYISAANQIKIGVENILYRPELNRFARMVNRASDGNWNVDEALDSSLFGLWYFGMFPADDPRIVQSMKAVQERLWVKTGVGGMARYEKDSYHQQSQDIANVPGNPWYICTLWLAQWLIATSQSKQDLKRAMPLLEWCVHYALPSGVLSEQIHPYSGAPLSVSPLTWSHAMFVMAVQEYVRQWKKLSQ